MNLEPAAKRLKKEIILPDYTPGMLVQHFSPGFEAREGEPLSDLAKRASALNLTALERFQKMQSSFTVGEGVLPSNRQFWLETPAGYLFVTATSYNCHKNSILLSTSWNKLGAAKGGLTLTFQTQKQVEEKSDKGLSSPSKVLLSLHVDDNAKLLEITWLQGGPSYPGKVTRSVAQFFIHLLKPKRAYLYDLAKRVEDLYISMYLPFVKEDAPGGGGPGWYGEIGFKPANAWKLLIRDTKNNPMSTSQSRTLYYDAILTLRAQKLMELALMLMDRSQEAGGRFTKIASTLFGAEWQTCTFYTLMKRLFADMRSDSSKEEDFLWVCRNLLNARNVEEIPPKNLAEIDHNRLLVIIDATLHNILDWKDEPLAAHRMSKGGIAKDRTWEGELESRLPKPRELLS